MFCAKQQTLSPCDSDDGAYTKAAVVERITGMGYVVVASLHRKVDGTHGDKSQAVE